MAKSLRLFLFMVQLHKSFVNLLQVLSITNFLFRKTFYWNEKSLNFKGISRKSENSRKFISYQYRYLSVMEYPLN